MNSPISPNHYVPQTAEEIMQQIRECDAEIAKCNIELAKLASRHCIEAEVDRDCGGPSLEAQFLSGKTYPIPPFLSSCCESNAIPAFGGELYCAMCGEPC